MICVAASPSIDTAFEVTRLVPGRIHRPVAHVRVAGGKALNLARAARTLGARPLAVALLAEHGSAWIAEQLAGEGIDLIGHPVSGEVRRCLSIFDGEGGALTEFYEHANPVDTEDWRAFARLAIDQCESDRWFALSGSLPRGTAENAYEELVREAASRGAPTALDTSGPALRLALQAGPDLVKVNETEARGVLGELPQEGSGPQPDPGLPAIAEAARALRELAGAGERVAVITRGGQGAVLAGPEGLVLSARPFRRAPHPTGSGDAFLAGLLAARERGFDWPGALCLGHAAGTANAETPGAGVFDPNRAEALAGLVELDAL